MLVKPFLANKLSYVDIPTPWHLLYAHLMEDPEESRSLPLVVGIGRFGTEEHTVDVTATDVYGQTETLIFGFQLVERK